MNSSIEISIVSGEMDVDESEPIKYRAHCLNFDLVSGGYTREEAISELSSRISDYIKIEVNSILKIEHCTISQYMASHGLKNVELMIQPFPNMERPRGENEMIFNTQNDERNWWEPIRNFGMWIFGLSIYLLVLGGAIFLILDGLFSIVKIH